MKFFAWLLSLSSALLLASSAFIMIVQTAGGPATTVALTKYITFALSSSEYIMVPDNADFSGLTPMTAMIYTNANGSEAYNKMFFGHSNGTGEQRSWRLMSYPGFDDSFGVFINESGTATPRKDWYKTGELDGSWHQLAITFSDNDLKMYVDGALITPTTKVSDTEVNFLHDSTASLEIGSQNEGTGSYFNGSVSQAAIWSSVLTAAELLEIHNSWNPGASGTFINLNTDSGNYASSANLVFWARLGDGDTIGASGILDSSANANHGTPYNTPTINNF